jgi:autotransporter-associated beta strand protein
VGEVSVQRIFGLKRLPAARNASHPRRGRGVLAGAAAALLAGVCLAPLAANAQDATWTGANSGDWNDPGNWTTTVPTGTATFDPNPTNALFFTQNINTIGSLLFNAGATGYNITICLCDEFHITGTGVVDTVATAPQLFVDGGLLSFENASRAGNSGILNFGNTDFRNTASADNAIITNDFGGNLRFFNSATAGNATITNNDATIRFFDSSSAGNASILNQLTGAINFRNTSTAGNAQITNTDDGTINFRDQSTGGTATIVNNLNGFIRFSDTSNAGQANITNNDFGFLRFADQSSAGSATITNNGTSVTEFRQNSSAGSATIVNNDFGSTGFIGASRAGNATIINNASLFFGGTFFGGTANAENATIITNSGLTVFTGQSNGGNAQFITAAGAFVNFGNSAGNAGVFTAGSIAGAGEYIIGGFHQEFVVGSNNLSTEVSGVISECGCFAGAFTKVGTGTLTLSGINTYTGATTVNGGSLIVNGSIASSSQLTVNTGGSVGGTGTLPSTVITGGTLSPGNSIGTIQIAGNLTFVGAGNYIVEVSGANADRTNATGTATLTGTLEAVLLTPLDFSQSHIVLSATGGRTGTFETVTSSNPLVNVLVTYTPTDVLLALAPNLVPFAKTLNQTNVATALQNGLTGDPGPFAALFNLSPGGLPAALDQLSGELATGAASAGFTSMDLFLNLMLDPFLENRAGGAAGNVGGPALAFAPEGELMPDVVSSYKGLVRKAPPMLPPESRWTVWGAAYGGYGKFDGDTVIGSHDLNVRTGGVAGGVDYRFGNSVIGAALTGQSMSYSLDAGLGTGKGDAVQAGLYGSTKWGNAYVSAALSFGWYDLETSRTVFLPGITDVLSADFSARSIGGRIEGGYRFPVLQSSGVTPYGALQALSFHTPAYAETDAAGLAGFALNYAANTTEDIRSEIGLRFDTRMITFDNGVLILRGRAAWAHAFETDRSINAVFQNLPVAGFTVFGAARAENSALISAGGEWRLANGVSLLAKVDSELGGDSTVYAGTGTVRYTW